MSKIKQKRLHQITDIGVYHNRFYWRLFDVCPLFKVGFEEVRKLCYYRTDVEVAEIRKTLVRVFPSEVIDV